MHAYVNVARDLACKHLAYRFLVLQWGCDEMGEMGSSLVRSCGCTSSGLAVWSDALVKKMEQFNQETGHFKSLRVTVGRPSKGLGPMVPDAPGYLNKCVDRVGELCLSKMYLS